MCASDSVSSKYFCSWCPYILCNSDSYISSKNFIDVVKFGWYWYIQSRNQFALKLWIWKSKNVSFQMSEKVSGCWEDQINLRSLFSAGTKNIRMCLILREDRMMFSWRGGRELIGQNPPHSLPRWSWYWTNLKSYDGKSRSIVWRKRW